MAKSTQPDDLSCQLSALDQQLQDLMCQRAELLSQQTAQTRSTLSAPGRYSLASSEPTAPFTQAQLDELLWQIHCACLAVSGSTRVAFLGPVGTFTQAALIKRFGSQVTMQPQATIDDVFREVEAGQAEYGVVPVENSTEGVVNHTLDKFLASPLKICAEIELRIHQHLLVKHTGQKITRIYSHQQSLAQCREYLLAHYPGVAQVSVASNAEAARLAAQSDEAAAIAGELAAEAYQLVYQARNIEDKPDNSTRFLVIGPQSPAPSGQDKTTLLISAPNRPGMLYQLLAPIKDNNIMMTRIESRPSRQGLWDYVFFIDIVGHQDQAPVAEALAQLQAQASLYKWLGSYPAARRDA